jgi:hypothetical protein
MTCLPDMAAAWEGANKMTYQYQRRLNPFKAGKAATTTRVLKRPPGMKAEAKLLANPSKKPWNTMQSVQNTGANR